MIKLMKNSNDMVYDIISLSERMHFNDNRVLSVSRVRVAVL
jgi:hypothetical protein